MQRFKGPTVTRHDNGDGTTTVTTVTYKIDGSKVTKRKTEPTNPIDPNLPENVNRSNRNSVHTVASLEGVKHVLQEVLGKAHMDNASFHSAVNRAIPAEFVLLASQDDVTQAQEDFFASKHFGLPDHRSGQAGSVATCALLQLMLENPKRVVASKSAGAHKPIDCRELIHEIKSRVKEKARLEAKPTITSSRPLGPPALKNNTYAPFYVVPPGFNGKRRALLIGCSSGEGEEDLKGPPNDITNIRDFLMNHCGFKHEDIEILRDDAYVTGNIKQSTKKNIMDGFAKLVKLSKPGDVCFVQYSGHGGRLGDNLCIFPCDYKKNGFILDDDILLDLVKHMPAQVHTCMLVDCCYSGCIGDLPYTLHHHTQDGDPQRIGNYYDTNTRQEAIKNKEQPSKDYLAKKEARSKWKNVTRLGSIAATYAQEFAKEVEKGSSAFAEQAKIIVDRKTKEMREAADSMRSSGTQNTNSNLRRSKTEDVPSLPKKSPPPPASKPAPIRRVQSTATPETMKPAFKPKPIRRTKTVHEAHSSSSSTPEEDKPKPKAAPRSIPRPSKSPQPPLRRVKTDIDYAREAEEAARRASIGKKEALAQPPRRSKSMEDAAFEAEEAARRAAVGKKETVAQPKKDQPRRSKSMEDEAVEAEEAARRAAVGTKEKVVQGAPRKSKSFKDEEDEARRAAVEKSREEAALARAHLEEERARKEAVERSRREKEELASKKAEEAARREAVERSKREAAATDAARQKREADAAEAARKAAVEKSREEAALARAQLEEEKARKEAVERSRREKEELASKKAEEAARKAAVERSKREAAAARQHQ